MFNNTVPLNNLNNAAADADVTGPSGPKLPVVAATPNPGLPPNLALSPSRAGDFMRCPLLFRFRAIDRFVERPGSAAARGTLVHAILEDLFSVDKSQRTLETAQSMIIPTWDRLVEADPLLAYAIDQDADFPPRDGEPELTLDPAVVAAWLAAAKPLLRTYFQLEDPARLEPTEREMMLEVELDDGPRLRGIVDRLDVSPTGLMRVVDYKTGRSPGPGWEQRALFQMRFYALMLWRTEGSVPALLQLLYLGDGETLRYEPNEDELIAFERKLRALWEAIRHAGATGDWRPTPSKLCAWCDHHARCPAKGGILPELPKSLAPGTVQA